MDARTKQAEAEIILDQATEEFWTIAYDGEEALTHRPTDWTQEQAEEFMRGRRQRRDHLFRVTRSAVEHVVAARGAEVAE